LITSKAILDQMTEQEAEQYRRELKRKEDMAKAKEEGALLLDTTIGKKIEEEAKKGYREVRLPYNKETEQLKYEALAAAALKRGFRVRFYVEEIDHGDSAAPCRVDHHYLNISWGSK